MPDPNDPYAAEAAAALDATGQAPQIGIMPGTLSRALEALQAVPGASRWDPYVEAQPPPESAYQIPGAPPADYSVPPPPAALPMPPEVAPTDREVAERGQPGLTGVAGYDPYAPPSPVTSVAQGETVAGDALTHVGHAQENAAQLQLEAQSAQAGRLAGAYEKSASENLALNQRTQAERSAMHAQADAETATWLEQMTTLAKQEPSPSRWWDNQSGFGRAMWALSLLTGAAYTALTPGARNTALEMVRSEIQSDMATQRARLDAEMATAKLRGGVMKDRQTRNVTDLMDDHSWELGRIQSLERAYAARAQAPSTPEQAAAQAQVQANFAALSADAVGKKLDKRYAEAEARTTRNFTAGQNALSRAQADRHAAAELQYKYDALGLSASMKTSGPGSKQYEDYVPISPATGAKLVDAKGQLVGDGTVWVHKSLNPEKVLSIATGASEKAQQLKDLRDAIADDHSWAKFISGSDAKINAASAALLKSTAAAEGGFSKTTDRETALLEKANTGISLQDWKDRAKAEVFRKDLIGVLDNVRDRQKASVDHTLSAYRPPDAPAGAHIDWSPQDVVGAKPRKLTYAEELAKVGGQAPVQTLPTSVEELRSARAHGADPRLTETEAAGKYAPVLQDLANSVEGHIPSHIEELVNAAKSRVTPDPRAGEEGSKFAKDAYIPDIAERALKDAKPRYKSLVDRVVGAGITSPRGLSPEYVGELARNELGFDKIDPGEIDEVIKAAQARLDSFKTKKMKVTEQWLNPNRPR